VRVHVLGHRHVGVGVDVGFDVGRAHFRPRRETVHLAVRDRAHERGLPDTIRAAQAVPRTLAQGELGAGEENFAAIRERELALAQLGRRVVVVVPAAVAGVAATAARGARGGEGGGRDLGGGFQPGVGREQRGDAVAPRARVEAAVGGERGGDGAGPFDGGGGRGREGGADRFGGGRQRFHRVGHRPRRVRRRRARRVSGGAQRGDCALDDGPALRVARFRRRLFEQREQRREERLGVARRVDQLGHVGRDERGLAHGGGVLGAQAADDERDEHGEGRRLDGLDEGRARHPGHALGRGRRVRHGAQDGRHGRHEVGIPDERERLGARLGRRFRDVRLGVAHHGGDGRDDSRQPRGGGVGRRLGGGAQAGERGALDAPRGGRLEEGEQGIDQRARRAGAGAMLGDGGHGVGRGRAHVGRLVGGGRGEVGGRGRECGLADAARDAREGRDREQGALTHGHGLGRRGRERDDRVGGAGGGEVGGPGLARERGERHPRPRPPRPGRVRLAQDDHQKVDLVAQGAGGRRDGV